MTAPIELRLLIVTDLDGTLLDHHSYSFAAATAALSLIAERRYPLILNSSKTRLEMLSLQQQLGLRQPFICENGAAVYLPDGDDWQCHYFATPRQSWLPWVHQLRDQLGFKFTGFSDWSVQQIAEITGLSQERAALAAQREFSEPLQWQDEDERRQTFEQQIAKQGLRLVRGGRFYSLQGEFDKATAMLWLKQYYQQQGPTVLVALGDSPNDCAMLNAADIAVVIKSANSDNMDINGPQQIIRTELPGPEGWQQAMSGIIADIDKKNAATGGITHG